MTSGVRNLSANCACWYWNWIRLLTICHSQLASQLIAELINNLNHNTRLAHNTSVKSMYCCVPSLNSLYTLSRHEITHKPFMNFTLVIWRIFNQTKCRTDFIHQELINSNKKQICQASCQQDSEQVRFRFLIFKNY